MATAGAAIASATVVEEVIVAEAARRLVAAVMRTAAGQHAPAAVVRLAATQGLTIQAVRVPVQVMLQLRVAAEDIPAVVVVVDMPVAADIDNPLLPH